MPDGYERIITHKYDTNLLKLFPLYGFQAEDSAFEFKISLSHSPKEMDTFQTIQPKG